MTKFKQGDKVIYNKEEYIVEVASKNFGNGHISYKLQGLGEKVSEDDLTRVGSKRTQKPADDELVSVPGSPSVTLSW